MTVQDLSSNVGLIGSMRFGANQVLDRDMLTVNVRILEFKVAYGNPRYLITPVSGTGSQWVNADRVKIVEEKGTGNE